MTTMSNTGSIGSPPTEIGDLFASGYPEGAVRVRLPGSAPRLVGLVFGGTFMGSCKPWPEKARVKPKRSVSFYNPELKVGDFKLGVQIIKGHVVREPLGVLSGDVDPLRENSGPLSFVEKHWKARHLRSGFIPRLATGSSAELSDPNRLQTVHWSAPERSAKAALDKAAKVKVDPGRRIGPEAPAGARLRQRAAWVLSLNPDKRNPVLGRLLKGRWTPDLSVEFAHPFADAFVRARGGDVKFLGGGTVTKSIGGENSEVLTYVNASYKGGVFPIYPELLAKLASYATLRERKPDLVSALRTRALEWCKRSGFSAEETAETLGPSVALAYLPSAQEVTATEILRDATSNGSLPKAEGWWSTST